MAVSKPSTKKRTYDEMISASASEVKPAQPSSSDQKRLKVEQPVKRDLPAFLKKSADQQNKSSESPAK
jgi:hypothetical protein